MFTPKITLEQWRALVAVVDAGSYAQAAERLNKTQSTVSYAVQQIEDRLSVHVFTQAGRRAILTPQGAVLYRRGQRLVDEAERLERTAANLAKGEEAVLRISVEILFPTWLILQCLARFAEEYPDIRIELHESVLSGSDELLQGGHVDLAIASRVPPGMVGEPFLPVRFIAAAAPHHPLHRLARPLTLADLHEHRHLIIRDSGTQSPRDGAWHVSDRRWTVGHKATSIRAAVMGLGFAWYAEDIIREELDSGALVPLPLSEGAERRGFLYLVKSDPDGAGPGARRLEALLHEQSAQCLRAGASSA